MLKKFAADIEITLRLSRASVEKRRKTMMMMMMMTPTVFRLEQNHLHEFVYIILNLQILCA